MQKLIWPRLKLHRADKYLNCLKGTIDRFIASNPYSLEIEADPNSPRYLFIARVNHWPDDEWGLLIGDFAHNARSALDLLVYQLSSLSPNDKRRDHLQFPIFEKNEGYASHIKSYLAGIDPAHETIIEGFQPYHRVDRFYDDALWILQTVNNTDKHRVINVVGAIANIGKIRLMPNKPGGRIGSNIGISFKLGLGGPIYFGDGVSYAGISDGIITKDRTPIAQLTSPAPPQMQVQPSFRISIQFGKGNPRVEGRPVMDTLTFIRDRVEEVIGKFESILT